MIIAKDFFYNIVKSRQRMKKSDMSKNEKSGHIKEWRNLPKFWHTFLSCQKRKKRTIILTRHNCVSKKSKSDSSEQFIKEDMSKNEKKWFIKEWKKLKKKKIFLFYFLLFLFRYKNNLALLRRSSFLYYKQICCFYESSC